MILPTEHYEHLIYLAEQLDTSDDFATDARQFQQLSEMLRKRIYRYSSDPNILEMADNLPRISLEPRRRSFLEQMLPKSGRDMVGSYQAKEKIRQEARTTVAGFKEIRRWLGEG